MILSIVQAAGTDLPQEQGIEITSMILGIFIMCAGAALTYSKPGPKKKISKFHLFGIVALCFGTAWVTGISGLGTWIDAKYENETITTIDPTSTPPSA